MSRAETMQLVKKLRRQGFEVERTGSGHWQVQHPEREGRVVMAFSPNSGALHQTLKRLKEIGYKP